MRTNGMSLHKLPLFSRLIFITCILLFLTLPLFSYIYLNNSNLFYIFTIIFSLIFINKIEFNKKKTLNFTNYIIIFLVTGHIISILTSIVSSCLTFFNLDIVNLWSFMLEPDNLNNSNNPRTTQIVHNNGTWAESIRSVFIYGTAGLRYVAARTGPGRVFTIFGAIGTDVTARFFQNAINDPTYIREHYNNASIIWDRASNQVRLIIRDINPPNSSNSPNSGESVSNLISNFDLSSSFISNNLKTNIMDFINLKIKPIFDYFVKILSPVKVDYSNELLALQINGIAIALFILCISIILLFIAFLINVIILLYRDKLISYFKNKYIVTYLKLQTHIILLELIFIFIIMSYAFYNLMLGIHFIATHPIII